MKTVIRENRYNIQPENIYCLGKRANNTKRNFLFINKLLGKHIPVRPDIVKATGVVLSGIRFGYPSKILLNLLNGKLVEKNELKNELETVYEPLHKVLVIGFCETATGLGTAVAVSIKDSYYLQTTRENIPGLKSCIEFEEEHSHAVNHYFYSNDNISLDDYDEIVLVDDELTTGKTMLNLIERISSITSKPCFTILSILDWRDENWKRRFLEVSENIKRPIRIFSILSGEIKTNENEKKSTVSEEKPPLLNMPYISENYFQFRFLKRNEAGLFASSPRTGLSHKILKYNETAFRTYACLIQDRLLKTSGAKKILVVSDGENIYYPSCIASELQQFGYDVEFKTTTRSPIATDGHVIKDKVMYRNQRNDEMYIYNVGDMVSKYDLVLFVPEIDVMDNRMISENSITVIL